MKPKQTFPVIVLVDDEPDVLEVLQVALHNAGFNPVTVGSGEEALRIIARDLPAAIVLDLSMPKMDGFDVCRALKDDPSTSMVPIIIASGRTDELDRVLALELGADDYLIKPVSPRELILRIRKLLATNERLFPAKAPQCHAGSLSIDDSRHVAYLDGKRIYLTTTEFRLLSILLRGHDIVHTRSDMLRLGWTEPPDLDSRTLDTHIQHLRDKLGPVAPRLRTIRGVGYTLNSRDSEIPTE